MRAVKGRDTGPERRLRSLIHAMGYRFRLHGRDLPGKPDIVFRRRRKAIFVHGCFWHGHDCPRGARAPKTNAVYWREKIARNRARDARNEAALREAGWSIETIWECELRDADALRERLFAFLGPARLENLTGRSP
ncbi:MAG: DNA mismatch endonuclease Vsr [Salinarimonadaceae bacterium]|nr:MAG: DNA mismatch endonuclease Vsr [Salinarimonadaceae bacterium]TVR10695.1 MAG: DNA mismatch endonuclease Vsr [Salinarimonadaceae bacterium]